EAISKLEILEQSDDGFKIAEADLELRGPGDLAGTAQTGLPPFRMGNLLRDADLMTQAKARAEAVFSKDPALKEPQHAAIREYVQTHATRVAAVRG
ncbi:MAG: DNA helicase RecG, partial [Chthoniobacterales bacterium]